VINFSVFGSGGIEVKLSLVADFVSVGFLSCILLVSSRVIVFSHYYISGTLRYRRFIYLTVLFILSMIVLVISENFIALIVG
jgi:NADH-ubiquinone oxidoreductase chain 5